MKHCTKHETDYPEDGQCEYCLMTRLFGSETTREETLTSSEWVAELEAERRKAQRRKTTAARKNDPQAADIAQTDEAALEHVIAMMRSRSATVRMSDGGRET